MTAYEKNAPLINALLSTVQESVLLLDEQGNVVHANLMAEQLFKLAFADIVESNIEDLFEAPDAESVMRSIRTGETFEGVLALDKSFSGAVRRRRSGSYPVVYTVGTVEDADPPRYVVCIRSARDRVDAEEKSELFAELIEDQAGRRAEEAIRAQSALREQSEALKQAELALSKHEREVRDQYAELAHLYESAPAALIYVNMDLTIARINRHMAVTMGIDLDSAVGRSLTTIDSHVARVLRPFVERVQLHSQPIDATEITLPAGVVHDTGSTWVANFVPISMPGGGMRGILASLGDITAWKRAEAAYRRSEERFRRLTEASFEGVVIHRDGIILECNEAFAAMFGIRPRQSVVGRNLAEILPAPDARAAFEKFLLAYRDGHIEVRARRASGSEFSVEIESRLIEYEDGPASVLGVRDITERRRAEQHTRQLQRLESLATLAGGIAHEFNNVLAGAIGYAELAQSDAREGSRIGNSISEVQRALNRAHDLVRQLLAFSSTTRAGARELDLHSVLENTLESMDAEIPSSVEVVTDFDHPCGPVFADSDQIQLAVANLCENAYQAMGETGGTLTVSLREVSLSREAGLFSGEFEPGRYARIRIVDTGLGMAPETMERMYEPFYSAEGLAESPGLGLATVYGIVRMYGGAISAESTPGEGTQMDLYFPLAETKSTEFVPAAESRRSRGGRALIVDDEDGLVQLMSEAVRRCGLDPAGFTNPHAGLEAFRREPETFTMVVTDLTMPEMDGLELIEAIRPDRPELPAIIVTGYRGLLDTERTEKLRVREIVSKPFRLQQLTRLVDRVLESETATPDS